MIGFFVVCFAVKPPRFASHLLWWKAFPENFLYLRFSARDLGGLLSGFFGLETDRRLGLL